MRTGKRWALVFAMLSTVGTAGNAAERTSVDLYCRSMVNALIDTLQFVSKKPIPLERLKQEEKAMSQFCLATPAVSPKPISRMSSNDIALVSCVGFAEGAYIAYQPKGAPDEPYSMLKARREFAANSCASNPKAFQDDIFRHGPDYVLKQRY
ncbi:hypothetical protein [Paraburkholderia aspalathi]|uniref:hypothetical protein n=1 Tax=Paraburkholderia aspalathi TaxID=1324617 RepID=UPI001AFE3258|nr:hypothetical protein [Paraburkholderia aspalathi]CAE6754715.1 hypothetical protein R20943_03083 [Paraburkholderia aspalathi]